jgi:hypothetical protein
MGPPKKIILTASIVGALTFTACEFKATGTEAASSVSPTAQPADPATQPAYPVAKTATFETTRLGVAIDTFQKAPTVENQSSVKLAFAKLNREIAKLENRVVKTDGPDRAEAAAKLDNLQEYRDAERIRFAKAHPAAPVAQTTPFETTRLGAAIDTFEKAPSVENQSSVKLDFAEVDGDIADLVDRVVKTDGSDRAEAAARLNNLQTYHDAEMTRFTNDQTAAGFDDNSPADGRSGAQKVKDAAKKVEKSFEKAAKDTGDAINDATH